MWCELWEEGFWIWIVGNSGRRGGDTLTEVSNCLISGMLCGVERR